MYRLFPLYRAIRKCPWGTALKNHKEVWTYHKLFYIVLRLSVEIKKKKLADNQPFNQTTKNNQIVSNIVACHLSNSIEYIILYWSLSLLKYPILSLNYKQPFKSYLPFLKENKIKYYILNQKYISILPRYISKMFSPKNSNVLFTEAQLKNKISILSDQYEKYIQINPNEKEHNSFKSKILKITIKLEHKIISLNQITNILFTSSSTGDSKSIIYSYKNHYYSAIGSNKHLQLKKEDTWLLNLPLYHISGISILYRTTLKQASIFYNNQPIIDSLRKHVITYISIVPTQFYQILTHCYTQEIQNHNNINSLTKNKEYNKVLLQEVLKNIKVLLIGGSYIPRDIRQICEEYNIPLYTTYGSSEMSSQITTSKNDESLTQHSGTLLPFRKVYITDQKEILVSGPTLFIGHLDKGTIQPPHSITTKSINEYQLNKDHTWVRSGDIGYWDSKDHIVVQGRIDNIFISGGENIQPEEIENILNKLPYIKYSVILPIKNHLYQNIPIALLKFINGTKNSSKDSNTLSLKTLKQIHEYLKRKLPNYKIPKGYTIISIEYTNELKLSRKKVQQYLNKQLEKKQVVNYLGKTLATLNQQTKK